MIRTDTEENGALRNAEVTDQKVPHVNFHAYVKKQHLQAFSKVPRKDTYRNRYVFHLRFGVVHCFLSEQP